MNNIKIPNNELVLAIKSMLSLELRSESRELRLVPKNYNNLNSTHEQYYNPK